MGPASEHERASAENRPFTGFPARPQATAIPNVFFTDVLPGLSDPVALGVTLFAIHALMQKKGFPRYLRADELAADPAVARYLENCGHPDIAAAVNRGLRAASEAGVLQALTVEGSESGHEIYFLNAPADRRGMDAVASGSVDVGGRIVPIRPAAARPSSVFQLYESLIGSMSPLIAEELAEAERLYPAKWLEDAFREAAAQNARSWRYVSRILERWASEGRGDEKTERLPAGEERYFRGKYGRILRKRLDG